MTIRNSAPSSMASHDGEAMAEEPGSPSAAASDPSPDAKPLDPRDRERVRRVMLERLSTTSAHFAHRQRDAPDLTSQEKVDIAAGILDKSPVTFLDRFGKFLHASDLAYFHGLEKDSYEIGFYLKDIRHRCSHSQVIVKNRRYSAMKELEEGGVYFSEDEMKRREPLLYQQMIGRFMTEEEHQQKEAEAIDRSDLRFSTILLNHMDIVQERALYKHQKEEEECQEEEEEDSDEEEEEEDDDEEENRQQKERKTDMEEDEDEAEDIPEISDVRATDIWRQQLREEFKAIMHEKFLSGDDSQFDYSKVDDNPDYDSLQTVAQDEENKYFLSEDPMTVNNSNNSDSDRDSLTHTAAKMEQEEEEEDYMTYEPSAELVAQSARFSRTGTWVEEDGGQDG
ncbi:coiled-coil domain-containing protein 97-like [Babylonia areolata]|uniref:coiled-coil domain-containing protein 97-like n=1 Tax=Babylonia areolata TaxID=304850 RepID=UPI003FD237A9